MIPLIQRLQEKNITNENGTERKALSSVIRSFPDETVSDTFWRVYIQERKTISEIARIFTIDRSTVKRYLRTLDIPIRDAEKTTIFKKINLSESELKTKLYHLYTLEKKKKKVIGNLLHISPVAVSKYIRLLGVPAPVRQEPKKKLQSQKKQRKSTIIKENIKKGNPEEERVITLLTNIFPHESISEKLKRLHWNEGKSLREIGRIFHVKDITIKKYMILEGVSIMPYPDPRRVEFRNKKRVMLGTKQQKQIKIPLTKEEIRKKRREGMLRAWSDPERKEKWIALLWSPEARKKRQIALKRAHQNNPNLAKNFVKRNIEINKLKALKKIDEVLGENPEKTLKQLYVDKLMTIGEISESLHVDKAIIAKWLQIFNIPRRKHTQVLIRAKMKPHKYQLVSEAIKKGLLIQIPKRYRKVLLLRYPNKGKLLSLSQVGKKMEGISGERVRVLEKAALEKLQKITIN